MDVFEPVWNTVAFSRELFGLPRNDAHIEQVLRDLTLWDKRKNILKDLSGGMKRRVMIAKALAHEPDILFLDEPTAALDARAEYEVFQRFQELSAGRSAVLISHRFSSVRMADRILVLADGRVEASGTHGDLLAAGGRYAELFELQAAGYR